jgi:hypothetical protein
MTDKLKNQIIKYLNKTYYVKEGRILRKSDDVHEWGVSLEQWLSEAFSTSKKKESCYSVLSEWYKNQEGAVESDKYNCWSATTLRFKLSFEMANDLERLGISNIQGQMINLVIDELSKEIDTTILKKLKNDIKTTDELISLIKCIGYEQSPVVYNPVTLLPEHQFRSVRYHKMIDERQSNNIWQNHFRPTRVD